jgi:UDP-glucose 4-epimerase
MSNRLRSALVTGATGFLGSMLVRRLLAEGVEVTCPVRTRSLAKLAALRGDPHLHVVDLDKLGFDAGLREHSAEVVFNLASYGVREGECDVEQMIEGNVSFLLRLLRATAGWPLRRFIHAGSCSEYGYPRRDGELIAETHPLRPQTLYGAAKAASVLCGNALAASLGIPFVTLRLFGVYGTAEAPQRLIPYLIDHLMRNEPVDLTGGEQVRDLLFEEDAASAFLAAANSDGIESGEVYNVCSARPARIREVGELVTDALRQPRDLLHWGARPYRAGEPMWLVGDNRRFRNATGSWSPSVDLQEGVHRMVDLARTAGQSIEK